MIEAYEMSGWLYVRLETRFEDCEIRLEEDEARELVRKLQTELESY